MIESINDIEWKVSDDRLSVFVRFPEPVENPFSASDFDQVLSDNRIVVKCNPEVFEEAQKEGSPDWVTVASGTRPQDGVDAWIEYYLNPSLVGRDTESEEEEERVDHKELQKILNVEKGVELARKHDPIPGQPGSDVYGKPIDPKEPDNFSIPAGQGVEILEDGHLAIASEDGAISTQGQLISVIKVYPVSGNISYRTGNISFKGTVDISGDVQTGFEVKADGDILVNGLVEGALLEAGGDIMILGGFQGGGKGTLKAGGSIKVRFANEGVLEAEQDVVANVHLLNCSIRAGNEIRVVDPKGVIAGGDNRAGKEIFAPYLGTDLGVKTSIQIGLPDDPAAEIHSTEKEIEETTQNLAQVEEVLMGLEQFKTEQGTLPRDREEDRIRTVREQFAIMGDLGKQNKRLVQQKGEQDSALNGKITAKLMAYTGVTIRFPGNVLLLKDDLKYTYFYSKDGEIRTGVL